MKSLAQHHVSIALGLAEDTAVNVNIAVAQSLLHSPLTVALVKLLEVKHVTVFVGSEPGDTADELNVKIFFLCVWPFNSIENCRK